MPRNWYRCPACGLRSLRTYLAQDVGGPDWPPVCEVLQPSDYGCEPCTGRLELAPQPGDFYMDLRTDGDASGGNARSFQKFTTVVNGRREVIDSLHKLRQVERDSEQRYRNGEGEPVRFRLWNQDDSNRDVNSFGTAGSIGDQTYSSGEQPTKSGKVGIKRHGQDAPEVTFGPGMRGRAASPFTKAPT